MPSLLTIGRFQWHIIELGLMLLIKCQTAIEISATQNLFKWCLPRIWIHSNRIKGDKFSEDIVRHVSKLLNEITAVKLFCVKKKIWCHGQKIRTSSLHTNVLLYAWITSAVQQKFRQLLRFKSCVAINSLLEGKYFICTSINWWMKVRSFAKKNLD